METVRRAISKRFHIDVQIRPNNGRAVSLTLLLSEFFDVHAHTSKRASLPLADRVAGRCARDIASGRAPVNRINARNLYMRKNGEVKTNDSLLLA